MDSEVDIDVNGKPIATYLLSSKNIDCVLEYVFNECIPTVVGFDIGQSNTLYLSVEFICIIIPWLHPNTIPQSLVNFLSWPDHTFVGVGINWKILMLETYFGIRCRNAVELGPLAADVLGMPHLRTCGVDKLALEVLGFDLGRWRLVNGFYEDYLGNFLLPTVNVCSCYQIGRKLLEKRAAIPAKIGRKLLAKRAAISAKRGRVISRKNWLVRFGFRKSRFVVLVMIFLVFVGCIMNFDEFRKSIW